MTIPYQIQESLPISVENGRLFAFCLGLLLQLSIFLKGNVAQTGRTIIQHYFSLHNPLHTAHPKQPKLPEFRLTPASYPIENAQDRVGKRPS